MTLAVFSKAWEDTPTSSGNFKDKGLSALHKMGPLEAYFTCLSADFQVEHNVMQLAWLDTFLT